MMVNPMVQIEEHHQTKKQIQVKRRNQTLISQFPHISYKDFPHIIELSIESWLFNN